MMLNKSWVLLWLILFFLPEGSAEWTWDLRVITAAAMFSQRASCLHANTCLTEGGEDTSTAAWPRTATTDRVMPHCLPLGVRNTAALAWTLSRSTLSRRVYIYMKERYDSFPMSAGTSARIGSWHSMWCIVACVVINCLNVNKNTPALSTVT